MAKSVLARMSLRDLRWLIVGVLCLMGVTVVASYFLYDDVVSLRQKSMETVIRKTASQVSEQVAGFFEPITKDLEVLRQWGEAGLLSLDRPEELEALVLPLVKKYPQRISGFMLADTQGREFKTIRFDEVWSRSESDYDPRTRPWFGGALKQQEAGEFYRTQVYQFFTSGEWGMTYSVSFMEKGKRDPLVVALDVMVTDFGSHMERLYLPEDHCLFIQSTQATVDLTHMITRYSLTEGDVPESQDSNSLSPVIVQARKLMSGEMATQPPFFFTAEGQRWGAKVMLFGTKDKSLLCLVLPEEELATDLNSQLIILFVVAGTLFVLLLLVLVVGVRHQHHLLHEAIDRKGYLGYSDEQLAQAIADGEDKHLEFKSTLRWNLKADRADKAMEIACLKTMAAFLNSEGGTLLVGVEDDGQVQGIEADRFPNEDKFLLHFNNLVNQHLGAELARFFTFAIRTLEDKGVLVVDCHRSAIPVFVKHDKKEDFYVRMGPGTRLLTTSEALDYIANHF